MVRVAPGASPSQLDGRVRRSGRRRSRRPLRDGDRAARGHGRAHLAVGPRVFEHGPHSDAVAVVRDITEQRRPRRSSPRPRRGCARARRCARRELAVGPPRRARCNGRRVPPDPRRRSARLRRHLRTPTRVHPRRRPRSGTRRDRAVDRDRSGRAQEYRIVRPDGETARCTRAPSRRRLDGPAVGLRGIGQDITEDRGRAVAGEGSPRRRPRTAICLTRSTRSLLVTASGPTRSSMSASSRNVWLAWDRSRPERK